MPSSIKLKKELGDDFNVLFVESQLTPADEMESFVYWMRWGGSQGLWTTEAPCNSGSNGLPSMILLGNDGRVLSTGYATEKKLEELIQIEIKAAKSAPKDTPPPLAKAYQDFGKGAYASAILAANKLAETPAAEDKAGVADMAKVAAADWTKRATARIERIQPLIDKAQFARADAEVAALEKAVKGLPELESKLAEQAAKLASDELKPVREAAKALDGVLAKVNEKGVEDKTPKDLKRLADKYGGTKPGDRAARLAKLLESKPPAMR